MNKRMIELANKANEDIGYTFKLEGAKQLHELMEKFAELLIRECALQCVHNEDMDLIEKHFGVKE